MVKRRGRVRSTRVFLGAEIEFEIVEIVEIRRVDLSARSLSEIEFEIEVVFEREAARSTIFIN